MTTFATRLCGYSVVGDTYKTALDVYNWVKKKESVGPIIQTAEDKAISVIKPIVESGIVQKIDDMACQHVLDRAEAACAQIKNTSNECIILPTASRALNIAEACANLYLPKDDDPKFSIGGDATPTERLVRLQHRASIHAVTLIHSTVDRANSLLSTLATYGSNLNQTVSKATIRNTLSQAIALYELAYSTAKAVSLPIVARCITVILENVRKLEDQIKESKGINWMDLKRLVTLLEHMKERLDVQEPVTEIELEPITEKPTFSLISGDNDESDTNVNDS
ncbi:unnamed protein product [Schistosoma bovis]|uniref:Uncharacterized protein n=3 Tax=Schistosoma TaxID=6181 RepID=A0A094ZML1_SCHHA|nr:hypothetical protein MS3_00006179 [Schistosoma haematobium]RTG86363.1 uncharacterized protein DC041_0011892 [Schistosoma bovis]CAH8493526.1 unnamed protein product [Schistosoma mattheei]CAH8496142.1 unnamed protein product [Schistosoma intercalatum]CAH8504550.1 unnamed protein product [Schistosoma curassoni]KAH9584660.1 hypothetical protein MS3_00006179 [Schistosoma haematobium]